MEANTKLQAAFRRYNPNIPSYLRERPHHIIKHCLEKRSLAGAIPSGHVEVIDITNGVFSVESQSSLEDKTSYRVEFGTKQPSCECFDWERHRLPCKHFFAVFTHVPLWSFDKLPSAFKDSPFFTLDEELFMSEGIEETSESFEQVPSQCQAGETVPEVVGCLKEEVTLNDLPRKAPRTRTSAARCRELLGQVKNMTYIVEGSENGEVLQQVTEKLEECHHLLLKAAPKENGVILESQKSTQRVVKKKAPKEKGEKTCFQDLAGTSKTKSIYRTCRREGKHPKEMLQCHFA